MNAVPKEVWIDYNGGLHLRDTLLWLDAAEARQLCFISHALAPSALEHAKIIATEQTQALLRALSAATGRGRRVREPQTLISPYSRRFSLGTLGLELFPSGHTLGAASLLIEWRSRVIVYAGPINPRRQPLLDRLEARRCDQLVLPCVLGGAGRAALPPQDEVERGLLKFVDGTLADNQVPVLLCPSLGVAQRLVHLLTADSARPDLALRVHREIHAICRVYEQNGALDVGQIRRFSKGQKVDPDRRPEVVLWPQRLAHSATIRKLPRALFALVSEQVLDPVARAAAACDASFALSCHADHRELLDYVKACGPEHVVLLGPGADNLADDLIALGISTRSLGEREQLALF